MEQAAEQDLLASASALLVVSAKVRAEVIAGLSCCRVIARYGIGTDNIDIAAATAAGILVTNVPDFCVTEVADHTMALLLGTVRKLRLMDRATRAGQWQARVQEPVRRVAGRVLGLIGFGRTA
ncbi:MAG TPA: NAD(P)-dependent oxidoreductase, partial [Bryobacteraceae bacterium]|nr:NAD(P)-dependent oxidoreductase [Bryobacteraceae bacterium]